MNRRINFLYLFFLRLPEYLLLNGLLNLLVFFAYKTTDAVRISGFTFTLFILLFIIKELIAKKSLSVAIQLFISILFYTLSRIFFGDAHHFILIAVFTYVFLVHSLVLQTSDYRYSYSNISIIILFLTLVLLMFYGNSITFKFISFKMIIIILCKQICYQMQNMDWFINSYKCTAQSLRTIKTLTKNSLKLIFFYLLTVTLFSLPVMVQKFTVTETSASNEEVSNWLNTIIGDNTKSGQFITNLNEPVKQIDSYDKPVIKFEESDPTKPLSSRIRTALIVLLLTGILAVSVFIGKRQRLKGAACNNEEETIETEDCTTPKKNKKIRMPEAGINRKIRKLFISKVKKYTKTGLSLKQHSTAKNIITDISVYEAVDVLDELYHKARYGNEVLTKSDLSRLETRKTD